MVGTLRVKIAININDTFQGVLRCATHQDSIPSSLKSVRLIPLDELSNNDTKLGKTTIVEPLPKKSLCELDNSILHILLTTMKSAIVLTDREGNQYVLRSRSTVAVTITAFSQSTATTTSTTTNASKTVAPSRLPNSLKHFIERERNDDDTATLTGSQLGSKDDNTSVDKLAWFRDLKKTNDISTTEMLQEACQSCMECNEPTPTDFVTQMIPSVILGMSDTVDITQLTNIVTCLWMTLTAIEGRVRNPNRDKDKVLRVIQMQFLMRLQLLAMDATAFVSLYSNKLIDRRKRKSGALPPSDVMTEVIAIVEQAPFLLGLETTLSQFLHDTIPPSIVCSIPEEVQEIFDFFECANPFVPDNENGDDDTHFSSVMEGERNSPPKKKVRMTQNVISPQHDDRILQTMHLTSSLGRRTNPLLKDAKGVYVCSHFNTKLANMSAHYHEVQHVLPSQRKQDHASPRGSGVKTSPLKMSKTASKSALKPRNNNHRVGNSNDKVRQQSPFARRGRTAPFDMGLVGTKPESDQTIMSDLFAFITKGEPPAPASLSSKNVLPSDVVDETPTKVDKTQQDLSSAWEEDPFATSAECSDPVVGETPEKKMNKNRPDFFSLLESPASQDSSDFVVLETPIKLELKPGDLFASWDEQDGSRPRSPAQFVVLESPGKMEDKENRVLSFDTAQAKPQPVHHRKPFSVASTNTKSQQTTKPMNQSTTKALDKRSSFSETRLVAQQALAASAASRGRS